MKWLICCLGLVLLQGRTDALLFRTLDALTRGLHFMQDQVSDINLDAVFCVRQIQEQLQTYLTHDHEEFRTVRHWIEVLRDKAKRIADQGRLFVHEKDAEYDSGVGFLMGESRKLNWYPSRNTSARFVEDRIHCSSPYDNLNETASDLCFAELDDRNNATEGCSISPTCKEMMSIPHQREYVLTHQMLFWHMMELRGCLDAVPEHLQQRLCSNVMRDAKIIASANYPESHRDIFMEQIGLCGFWGFSDFNRADWLERILDWQLSSGCYSGDDYFYCSDNLQPDPPVRMKRREKMLAGSCWAHKTAVALLALVVNVRFEAEKAFQSTDKLPNGLNKLLSS